MEEAKVNYFEELKKKYTELWKLRIPKNEVLITPMFHTFLGVINPVRYVSGRYFSTRIHQFIVQPSGTFKTEILNLNKDLLEELGTVVDGNKYESRHPINPVIVTQISDAALVAKETYAGFRNARLERPKLVPGLLGESRFIAFDEAIDLFSRQPFYSGLRGLCNRAMNEDGMGGGRIHKELKGDMVDYTSKATIVAVTTPKYINEIREYIGDGFLERCMVHIQEMTEDEMAEFPGKVLELSDVNKQQIVEIQKEIVKLVEAWYKEALAKYVAEAKVRDDLKADPLNPYIRLKKEDIEEMNKVREEYRMEVIKEYFGNKKLQEELMAFFNRYMVDKVLRIAVQHAVFNLKDSVDVESYKYALEVVKPSMDSIIKLLETKPVSEEKEVMSKEEMEKFLIAKVKEKPEGWEMNELIKCLMNYRQLGKWHYGENKTRNMIIELVNNKRIFKKEAPIKGKPHRVLIYFQETEQQAQQTQQFQQ